MQERKSASREKSKCAENGAFVISESRSQRETDREVPVAYLLSCQFPSQFAVQNLNKNQCCLLYQIAGSRNTDIMLFMPVNQSVRMFFLSCNANISIFYLLAA